MKTIHLYLLFFLSGLTSLTLQIVWLRGFSLILGSTIYSMSAVVTVFMVGLAVGSYSIGKLLPRVSFLTRRPLLAYGIFEALIALYALVFTPTLFENQAFYLRLLTGSLGEQSFLSVLAGHFTVASALLIIPTSLMGMTLPLLSLLLRRKRDVGKLYAANTIGAAIGSVLASFVFIYFLGCGGTVIVAASINVAIFLIAMAVGRVDPPSAEDTEDEKKGRHFLSATTNRRSERLVILGVAIFSGFTVLACEIAWTRFLGLFLGNRIYVTSVTLGLILMSLGIAARYSGDLLRKFPPYQILVVIGSITLLSFGVAFFVEDLALSISYDRRALAVASAICFFFTMIIIPAIAMGLMFPITLSLQVGDSIHFGSWVGSLYSANTVASILGSLLAGYWLMGAVGANGIVGISAILVGFLVVILAYTYRAVLGLRNLVLAGAGVAALGVLVVPRAFQPPSLVPADETILQIEDAHGIFTVAKGPSGSLRVMNNRTELVYLFGPEITQFVQETQAYLPLLYAPSLDSVLNIGVGYGITVGAFTKVDEVKRIDAIEIVPSIIEQAHLFSSGNYEYYNDPRVHVSLTDGRHFLATTKNTYDIISVNLSDPYLPGSASLFSSEFYELAKTKLRPGGIFSQHIFGPDVATLYHGVKDHFRYSKAIPAYGNGVTLVFSDSPIVSHQLDLIRKKYDGVLFDRIPVENVDALLAMAAEGDERIAALEAATPEFKNTDDFPALEFRRGEGGLDLFHSNH